MISSNINTYEKPFLATGAPEVVSKSQSLHDFIGVIDSGAGGISVLAQCIEELPFENFIYIGDSANTPYGEKTNEWVVNRTYELTRLLVDEGAKAIVIACNTATAASAETLRQEFPDVPIIGVEPALKPASVEQGVKRILVMATPMTLKLEKYHRLAETYSPGHEVYEVECPGLAARIERGNLDAPDLDEMLRAFIADYSGRVDGVVLGCTHYPFIADQIRNVLGDVKLYDGALGTARHLKHQLEQFQLLTSEPKRGAIEFRSSDENPHTLDRYKRYLEYMSQTR